MNSKIFVSILAVSMLAGCASNGKLVPRGQGNKSISYGTITESESVTIGGSESGIGAYVVSAAAIHDARGSSFLGFLARALVGSAVGAKAEEVVTRKPGMRYTVDTANSGLIEVLSENVALQRGDCVQIATGRRHVEISLATSGPCGSPTQT
jgi:outer membrane lipoprotein SlyB